MVARVIAIVAALLIAGCAAFEPPRPFTTEAEAIAARGQPEKRWDNGDGTTTLEFSNQPFGHQTLLVTVDQSGVVLNQYDALSADNLARVERGMTKDDVSRLLGTHRSEQTFRRSGEEVWDWNIYNDGPGVATLFNVHFVDGKVVRTSRTYIFPNDGGLTGPMFFHPYPYYAYPYPFRPRGYYRGPYWRGYPWYW